MKPQRFAPLATALLVAAIPSLASVQVRIYEDGPDVIAEAIGNLDLPPSTTLAACGGTPGLTPNGAVAPAFGVICVGSGTGFAYSITGPASFGTGFGRYADSSSGGLFGVTGTLGLLATDGPRIRSRSTWTNTSLASLGLTPGDLGTWQLANGEQITARAEVPGPLGLLGVAAMWGWARRLRKRIREAG